MEELALGLCILLLIGFVCSLIGAWATHVIVCILGHQWLLLIAGALAFPVGIVHGFGVWFGFWH